MRIHVTEEARHLSFARHQLKRNVGELSRARRAVLRYAAPLVLSQMADQMLGLPPHVVKEHGIPREVVQHVRQNPDRRAGIDESLTKVRRLLRDCDLITPGSARLWRRLNLAV
jgi:HEAT repeat protein